LKKYVTIFILFMPLTCYLQSVGLEIGNTRSYFDYKNSTGAAVGTYLPNGGVNLGLSYYQPVYKDILALKLGLSYKTINTTGVVAVNTLRYRSDFIGIYTMAMLTLARFDRFNSCFTKRSLRWYLLVGGRASTMVEGSQQVDFRVYDLRKEPEFQGIWLAPSAGMQLEYGISDTSTFFINYHYDHYFHLKSTEEKVAINNQVIGLGLRAEL